MTKGIDRPDDFYETLIELHRGLDEAASQRANARLILLMAAEIGDVEVLKRLIATAREDVVRSSAQAV